MKKIALLLLMLLGVSFGSFATKGNNFKTSHSKFFTKKTAKKDVQCALIMDENGKVAGYWFAYEGTVHITLY